MLGVAVPDTFSVTLFGALLNFTENFISPTDSGITVNGNSYVIYPNKTTTIAQSLNPNYVYTMQIVNISYIPLQQEITVKIQAFPKLIVLNVTNENFTSEIITYNTTPTKVNLLGERTTVNLTSSYTAYQLLSIRNLTQSPFLPPLPEGYKAQLDENLSVRPASGVQGNLNTTLNVTVAYNCSVPFYKVVPFILANYSWAQVSKFSVDSQACTINMLFTSDPILAVTSYVGPGNAPSVTTVGATTTISGSATTTTSPTPPPSQPPLSAGLGGTWEYAVGAASVLVLIGAWLALRRRHRERPKEGRRPRRRTASRSRRGRRVPARAKKRGARRRSRRK